MSSTRRFSYIDFTKEPVSGVFAETTHAVATGADDQVDYTRVGNRQVFLHWIQTEASTTIFPVASASGWTIPIGATDGDAIIMDQGITAGDPTTMKFVVGTDAFFIKVKVEVTTLADTDCVQIGFRKLEAYDADGGGTYPNTPGTALTYYDNKVTMGTNTNAGAVVSMVSVAGTDTSTTATNTPIVTGTAVTWEIHVDTDGVCTFYVDGTADALLNASTARTLTDAITVVPYILAISTAAGAEKV
jgi:hypothetical protein